MSVINAGLMVSTEVTLEGELIWKREVSGRGCPSPTVHSMIVTTGVVMEQGEIAAHPRLTVSPAGTVPVGTCTMKTRSGGGTE